MGQTARFQETLRRLAMIDEGFVQGQAGLGLDPAERWALDPKTAALLQVAVPVAAARGHDVAAALEELKPMPADRR